MSRSQPPDDRFDGQRRRSARGKRGPRWVTDHAQDVVRKLPPSRRGNQRWSGPDHDPQPPARRPVRRPWDEDPDYPPRSSRRDEDWRDEHRRDEHRRDEDYGHERPRAPQRWARVPEGRTRPYETPVAEPPEPAKTRPREEPNGTGPRKLTVTRVVAWRGRQLTQQGIHAFRRVTTADGADRSGLTGLTYPVMLSFGADAAVAVALANTLFFSAATAESKTKVALYLLITVAPFALLAPVIGPMLDRLQRGRRMTMAVSFLGRGLLALVMAQHFDDWLLYPAALGSITSQSWISPSTPCSSRAAWRAALASGPKQGSTISST